MGNIINLAQMPSKELDQSSPAEMRSKIMQFESVLLQMPQVDIPIEHFFAPGLYLRQMTMPKDCVLTGKIHKTEHMCILAKGKVTVVTENGTKQLTAPAVIHSMPGDKRAIHSHEDTVWINVHHNPTDERDTDKIDDIFVVETFDQYIGFTERLKLEGGK